MRVKLERPGNERTRHRHRRGVEDVNRAKESRKLKATRHLSRELYWGGSWRDFPDRQARNASNETIFLIVYKERNKSLAGDVVSSFLLLLFFSFRYVDFVFFFFFFVEVVKKGIL